VGNGKSSRPKVYNCLSELKIPDTAASISMMSIELNWNIQDWSALISFDVHAAGPVIGDNWLSSFVSKIS
jgi:hypothetical protein